MSISHHWCEWHLTPRGWMAGSRSVDSPEAIDKPTPEDTVAIYVLHEYWDYSESPVKRSFDLKTCNDQESMKALTLKFGEHPEGVLTE